MVNEHAIDRVFQALSDSTRREMIACIDAEEVSVAELALRFSISMPAILKHISVLEQAGIISTQKVGRSRKCKLQKDALAFASNWIERYAKVWDSELDRLEKIYLNA